MDDALPITGRMAPGTLDILILLGAIVLISIIAFIWITFFRKSGRPRRRSSQSIQKQEQLKQQLGDLNQIVQKDKRRPASPQYPLNPTLAQTGGLPPVRPQKEPPGEIPPSP